MLKMMKLVLFALSLVIIGCDSYPVDINVKQSIKNMSSDTITIVNSLKEFQGIDVDTIICLPNSETIFFDCTLHKQPLEPYNIPLIYEGSSIYTSSGRLLIKNIYNNSHWNFDKQKKYEWLSFTIEETDLK
jgi:hypothetical protein